jgi:hypothetical protein
MRMMIAVALTIVGTSLAIAAPPDPYRWCAERHDGSTNCYFLTLEQCRAVSRNCRENLFFNPAPEGQSPARSRR